MGRSYLFTSESVCEGHPDKIADQIADAILDAILEQDPFGRVACECLVTTGMAFVTGEITTKAYVDIPQIVRQVIKDIGYTDANYGFDYHTCAVLTAIDEQSPDIAQGVNRKGAGDQGMMFGYATRETPELMPAPILYAHRLSEQLARVRKGGILPYLRPDGKTQVTLQYENGHPMAVTAVVVSAQHDADVKLSTLREDIKEKVIAPILPREWMNRGPVEFHINPTDRFVVGGPQGDSGMTGRKIVVDTYGGVASHGGGSFSGKDPTKVDRSATYAARWVAKNVVAAGLADRCLVQLAYAIGVEKPVSVMVESFGTGSVPDEELCGAVQKTFDLTPAGIIEALSLRRPIYRKTAVYGHFGRQEEDFTWERTDRVDDLKTAVR